MSEEKKAIEMLRNYDNEDNLHKIHQSINVLLNLIEKQQKEIEKYKKVIDNRDFTWKQKYEETFEYVNKEFISKDKIREKIKELEGQEDWYIENKSLDDLYGRIDELKELLEEE